MDTDRTATTKADLVNAVHWKVGLSRSESSEIVQDVLDRLVDAFVNDEMVKIVNFGTFRVSEKRERLGRNPKTGIEAVISKRRVLTFKSSSHLRSKINVQSDA